MRIATYYVAFAKNISSLDPAAPVQTGTMWGAATYEFDLFLESGKYTLTNAYGPETTTFDSWPSFEEITNAVHGLMKDYEPKT